ncbi:MAG TPA: trehalase family glycosidase [Acidobacteriaceae bacterium]|nr:trehalase family glycosidase [Acidobacteriaceae bacterium]
MTAISRRAMLYLTSASTLRFPAPLQNTRGENPIFPRDQIQRLYDYLKETAPKLLRDPAGQFAYPSVSPSLPGREYSASLWDWDTLWSCRGLLAYSEARSDADFHAKLLEHCKGSLRNFFEHQDANGRIPILMTDANADLLHSTGSNIPTHANQAKPVFAQLALLIARKGGGIDWMRPVWAQLLRFYEAWERNNLAHCGLFVWGDDVAIGNDNDPATFGRPFFSSANLLLNCLFCAELAEAAEIARMMNQPDDARRLSAKSTTLADRIRSLCWDTRDKFFYSVDVQCVDHRPELLPQIKPGMPMRWQTLPMRIQTFTGFLPMWCGIATKEQAAQIVKTNYLADDRLRCNSGVRTLSNLESMYSLDFSSNPSNWLGPVWIISNYFVWVALNRYGYQREAKDLAAKTLAILSNDIERNGSMNEYYHPDTGAALSHKGFMDWNLLVIELILSQSHA